MNPCGSRTGSNLLPAANLMQSLGHHHPYRGPPYGSSASDTPHRRCTAARVKAPGRRGCRGSRGQARARRRDPHGLRRRRARRSPPAPPLDHRLPGPGRADGGLHGTGGAGLLGGRGGDADGRLEPTDCLSDILKQIIPRRHRCRGPARGPPGAGRDPRRHGARELTLARWREPGGGGIGRRHGSYQVQEPLQAGDRKLLGVLFDRTANARGENAPSARGWRCQSCTGGRLPLPHELLGGVRKDIRDVPQPVQGSLRHGSCERRVRNESSSAPKSGQAWRPQAHPVIGTPRMPRRATLCSPYRTSPSPQAQPATRTARSRGRRRTPIAESSRCRRAP